MQLTKTQVNNVLLLCRKAGEAIMDVYENADFDQIVDYKADDSPLTIADTKAHHIIDDGLKQILDIPILSEEGRDVPYAERKEWQKLWMVDPLDGTKEFIKKNGEFTINIALIENGFPTAGFIYAPAKDVYYFAVDSQAFKQEGGNPAQELKIESIDQPQISVSSRSHSAPEETALYEKLGISQSKSMGSAFKFTLIAENEAHIYYRHNPTMEWDTAAGQALVEAAGGSVIKLDGSRFGYNRENLVNDSFIAYGRFKLDVVL